MAKPIIFEGQKKNFVCDDDIPLSQKNLNYKNISKNFLRN